MTILQMQVDHNVKREIRNMLLVNGHPFIITLLDVLLTDQHLVLVLEKAGGGELFSLVASKKQLSEEEARFYLQQIVLGVEHLHREGIYHRDLKLENILLEDSPDKRCCRIADLGYSKSIQDSMPHSTVGTPSYIAPEVLARGEYDGRKVDVWSMGVILFVMLCGRYPFEDPLQPRNMRKTMQRIMALSFDLPPSLSPNAADLINKMLSRAEVRIFVADIKAHPFLQPGFDQISADLGCAFKAKPIEAAVAEEIDVLLRHLQV